MPDLPGYDAWKLASPYDDERECPKCEAVFVPPRGSMPVCPFCGYGEPDPDEAREARDERDADPVHNEDIDF